MKLQLLAIPLLVALMLSPMFAAATTGTLTFTSPAPGSSFSGTEGYTISGTISPVPTPGTDNVNIQVTSPSSEVVDVQTVAVSSTGTFSYTTNVGGSSAWTSGTYKILATDSNGATNTETFTYQATCSGSSCTSGSAALVVNARSAAVVYAGQTVQIFASAYWTANGTLAKSVTWTATVLGPTGSPSGVSWTTSSPSQGIELWTGTLPAGTSDGVYAASISASDSGVTAWTLTSFQVNSQVASSSAVSALATSLASLTTAVSGITSSVSTLTTDVNGITSSVSTLTTDVNGITSSVNGITSSLSTLTSNLNSLTTTVNGISTSVGSISNTLGTLSTNVQGLGTSLTTIGNNVNTISSSITGITSSISTLTSDVTAMQSTVSSLQPLAGDMTSLQSSVSSLSSSVSNAQTYILVVAALAVITLVLELAILIRKMS